jgi:hypothetical protein
LAADKENTGGTREDCAPDNRDWRFVFGGRAGVRVHLHGAGYGRGRFAKVFGRFRGRVVTIYRSFLDRVGITNTAGYRVQFEITKQWKGTASKSIVVITRLTGEACGFPIEENKEYLVYVVTQPKDIQTGICTGTKNIAEAEQEMQQLDKILENRPR